MIQPKFAIVDYTVPILAEMWSCGNYHAEKRMFNIFFCTKYGARPLEAGVGVAIEELKSCVFATFAPVPTADLHCDFVHPVCVEKVTL